MSFNTGMLCGHFTWKLVLNFASFDVTSIQQNLVPRLYKQMYRFRGNLQNTDSYNSAIHYGLYWDFTDKF